MQYLWLAPREVLEGKKAAVFCVYSLEKTFDKIPIGGMLAINQVKVNEWLVQVIMKLYSSMIQELV